MSEEIKKNKEEVTEEQLEQVSGGCRPRLKTASKDVDEKKISSKAKDLI